MSDETDNKGPDLLWVRKIAFGASGRWHDATAQDLSDMPQFAAYVPRDLADARVGALLAEAETEARRYAGFYEAGTDWRNTFVIFADRIAEMAPDATAAFDRAIREAREDEYRAAIEAISQIPGESEAIAAIRAIIPTKGASE